jgi:ankyrin repeat protein
MSLSGSDLLRAARYGNLEIIRNALASGVDGNFTDLTGKTALMQAAGYGNIAAVRLLLEHGVNVNKVETETGASALVAAAVCCYSEIMRVLLDAGADVNIASLDGMTSLMFCSHKGCLESVQVLLDHKPDINRRNRYGETALMRATSSGSVEIVKILIESGAEPEIQSTEHGLTALMIAADNGHEDIVNLLLAGGADPSRQSLGLRTAADYARLKGFNRIVSLLGPRVEVDIPKTIKRIKDINKEATSQLIDAVYSGSLDEAVRSLENGGDPNPSGEDFPPVVVAAGQGALHILQLLINLGADVDATDISGISALSKACGACHTEAVRLLLENGAQVTQDAFMSASIHKPREILHLLHKAQLTQGEPSVSKSLRKGEKLLVAAADQNIELVKDLLESNTDVNSVDKDGAPVILWASRRGNTELVKLLLDHDADPDIASHHGWTAIMEAAICGHTEVTELLIKGGADINIQTEAGACSIIFAAAEGNLDVVTILLEHGADPSVVIRDGQNKGMTALEFARKEGHAEIVSLLQNA